MKVFFDYMYKVTMTNFQLHLNSSFQYNIHVFWTQNSLISSIQEKLFVVGDIVKLYYEEVLDPSQRSTSKM
jgi:hypothetical protein